MKKQILLATGLVGALVMGGCTQQPTKCCTNQYTTSCQEGGVSSNCYNHNVTPAPIVISKPIEIKPVEPPKPKPKKLPLIKISGIGYGAASTYEGFTAGQKRLMAIRASKLDAYRSLAEQLFGIKIDSNTSVSTLMAKNDNFRARVNAVVRGARVVSITPMPDDNYETVLEVFIDQSFFQNAFVYSACTSGNCEVPPVDLSQVCSSGMSCSRLGQ